MKIRTQTACHLSQSATQHTYSREETENKTKQKQNKKGEKRTSKQAKKRQSKHGKKKTCIFLPPEATCPIPAAQKTINAPHISTQHNASTQLNHECVSIISMPKWTRIYTHKKQTRRKMERKKQESKKETEKTKKDKLHKWSILHRRSKMGSRQIYSL